MVARWHPGGTQPTTAAPIFIPINETEFVSRCLHDDRLELAESTLLQLHCATQGDSIAWPDEAGDQPAWRLYTGPIRLEPGRSGSIRARAVRIGYADSPERTLQLA
jgi:hypothetical protein